MEISVSRRGLTVCAAAILAAAAVAVLPAGPARAASWSAVPTPGAVRSVDAVDAANVWVVGDNGLAARWNGTTWTATPTPLATAGLQGVDGAAPDDIWAVGRAGSGTLTEHWDGAAWSVVPSPNPPNATWSLELAAVKTFSAAEAWAVGSYSTSAAPIQRTLIERWNGSAWSIVPSPNPDAEVNLLTDVDGAAPDDIWAVGNVAHEAYGGTPRGGLVLHWDGSAWTRINVPGTVSDGTINFPTLEDVFVVSADDVWIVGRAFSWTVFRTIPIALHWNGQNWQRSLLSTGPDDGVGFRSVAALSATQVYAFGRVIARWTGTGWSVDASVSNTLTDATAIGPSTFWAVGGSVAMRQ